ncbi:hypothetical protein [Microbacterium murale]|uniref:Uncharacterized protein n=1 Tax=Microbacterium murale TaxID=1081040 RepID=A0ABQ1RXY7_9MICO|nr:hypothetical protein [Microbacterium murale]GGD83245.1 hypothetical protein GCM10007269_27630 [Microbacterium murale]
MDGGFVYERKPVPAEEGDDWLYYEPPTKRWYRVALMVVPEDAQRVRVQHLDREMKGKAEWVPIGRCRVPWGLREEYFATNTRWDDLYSHAPEDDAFTEAAEIAITKVLSVSIAFPQHGGRATLEVFDLDGLADATGMTAAELVSHSATIRDSDATYLPWPSMKQVAIALCRRNPQPIIEYIDEREREIREQELASDLSPPWYLDSSLNDDRYALRARRWVKLGKDARQILKQWIDQDQPGLRENYLALRQQHVELVLAVLPALDQLSRIRSKKSDQIAAEIREIIEKPLPQ